MKNNYIIKYAEGKRIVRVETSKYNRLLYHMRLIKWGTGINNVYLKVIYGKDYDCHGKLVTFYNDGDYSNSIDLNNSLQAFIE